MEGHGGDNHNLKNYRKEALVMASAVGVATTKRNEKKHEFPATKPSTAAQPSDAEEKKEKRKRLVRDRKAQEIIDAMIVHSTSVLEFLEEWLARCSEKDLPSYAKTKAHTEKWMWMADEQALIDQYLINGYAETIWKAIDDDEDNGNICTVETYGSKES